MILIPNSNKLILLLITILSISFATDCPAGNQCTSCVVTSCSDCSTDINLCITCSDRYFWESDTSCVECPSKCLSCSSLQQCDKCTPGYDTAFD